MSRKLLNGQMPGPPGPNAKKPGRPPIMELRPELIEKIEQAVKIGAPVLTAAALQGLSYDTVRSWVVQGAKQPDSIYGQFIRSINKAISEWEIGDLAVIHRHANGSPAQYEMEVVRDSKGEVVYAPDRRTGESVPLMQIARDPEGYPIIKTHAIKSDWRAAMERLSRRKPRNWGRRDQVSVTVEPDEVLSFDNTNVETKEALSFEQEVANAMVKFDDEY